MSADPAIDELVLRPDAPEGKWVLRHVAGRRTPRFEDYTDAAQRALTYVFHAFLVVVAVLVLFAILAAVRHDWPPGVLLIPIFVAAVVFSLFAVIWAPTWSWAESACGDLFPRRVYVYRDRVVILFPERPLLECPLRTMTVGWGQRGDDSLVWRLASERALMLRYWGWQHVPGPWGPRCAGATLAITGPDGQLTEAYALLRGIGIRPRRPTAAELLGVALAVAALASGVWAAW